jgi:PhzF family phenazine biosynthesis protein
MTPTWKPLPLMAAIPRRHSWQRGRTSPLGRRSLLLTEAGGAVLRACDHCLGGRFGGAVAGGRARLYTPAGVVSVATLQNDTGELVAELTSVAPRVSEPEPDLVAAVLHALRWLPEDLDPDYPVRLANAGSEHLVLVAKTRQRLADLDYDFDALAKLMRDHELITVQLVWPESKNRYHSRNPFAGSGVVEDPATGASAAAFGGYLRELGLIGEHARSRSSRHGPTERDQRQHHRG